jgi:hypothetical protein
MSKKALHVNFEYPYTPNNYLGSSVNGILEFNKCLTKHLNFFPTDIEILVDTSATARGDKQFNANEVIYKLLKLVCDAK